MRINRLRLFLSAVSAIGFSPLLVHADGETPSPPGGGNPSTLETASASNVAAKNDELFKTLRSKCETEVPCGKGSGDICADAAAMLLVTDLNALPDEFRDMSEVQRTKIALRLLEKGVDSSNIAAGRAYDLYNKTDLFTFGSFGGFTDSYRAKELMDLMSKRSYAGAVLRKARAAVSILAFSSGEEDKKRACATTRQLLAGGKLDADSTAIANEVLDTGACKNPVQNK